MPPSLKLSTLKLSVHGSGIRTRHPWRVLALLAHYERVTRRLGGGTQAHLVAGIAGTGASHRDVLAHMARTLRRLSREGSHVG